MRCDVLPNRQTPFGTKVEGKDLTLIVGKHAVRSYSPTGRGTKGYYAYVVGEHRLVFLKLTWRLDSPQFTQEHETYHELELARVQHVPKVLAGGDICHDPRVVRDPRGSPLPLRTRSQAFLLRKHKKLLPRVRYFLVLETVGVPLSEYKNSATLVRAVYHALLGALTSLSRQFPSQQVAF